MIEGPSCAGNDTGIVWALEPPDVVDDVIGRVARKERCKGVFGLPGGNLDAIGDDECGHPFLEMSDLVNGNRQLLVIHLAMLAIGVEGHTHVRNPTKNIGMEANVVL